MFVPDVSMDTAADIVTCIDRSGSMRGQKITDAKKAASTFVGLMNIGDMIGVTSFSSGASVNYPLTLIQGQTQQSQAISAVNSLYASGGTSIGSGMSTSQQQLTANCHGDAPWAIVLLSDGISNGSEYNVLPTIPDQTDIFTIGLGAGADEVLLNYIASETGGTYHAAPNSQDLKKIYNAIRGQITGQQTVASRAGSILQGATMTFSSISEPAPSRFR
jgi:Mg-chelatase subunit ChlD